MNSEERLEILRMLAAGKVSLEEAEMLFDVLGDTNEQRAKDQDERSDSLPGDFGDAFDDCEVIFGGLHDIFGDSVNPRNH